MTKKDTTTTDEPIDVIFGGERILPEAPASVNMRIDWNGADLQLTLRDFNENDLLARLVQIKPALEELGMTLKNVGRAVKMLGRAETPLIFQTMRFARARD